MSDQPRPEFDEIEEAMQLPEELRNLLCGENETTAENAMRILAEAGRFHREREESKSREAILAEALRFYSDVSKYPAPLTGGMGALWLDCGGIARAALNATGKEQA